MAKKSSLLDEVKSGLSARRGHAAWYESLDADIRSELEGIKSEWLAGSLVATKTMLARRLSDVLQARGVKIGIQGVLSWLEKA
jgi:hypothetical protein